MFVPKLTCKLFNNLVVKNIKETASKSHRPTVLARVGK